MEYTSKLGLRKPQRGTNADPGDINDLNYNFDKIDSALGVSDVKPRAEFPPASATTVGQSIVDENGKTWYCVKVRSANTTYGYETIVYTEGLEADVPAEGYYHSTDSDKWFNNGSEIEVDKTQSELPTPSADTVDKYYLIGTTLNLGTADIVPDLYAWICHNLQPEIGEERELEDMEEGIIYATLSEA